MRSQIDPFNDEQARTLVNLAQQYQVWMEAEQALHQMPYNLVRKEVNGKGYLYEVVDRVGNARSLGPWSDEAETKLTAYLNDKSQFQQRRDRSRAQLDMTCRIYRSLRLPQIDTAAGKILRETDKRRLLGHQVIVVGTNAMLAYSIEAAGVIRDAPAETLDFDIAWAADKMPDGGQPIWDMLKAVDPTYTVNTERSFQARNADAYEVEVLAAPSRLRTMTKLDRPVPVPLPEQEWLLNGRWVDQVIVSRDGKPARIVAPDPRWFALHKLWMSDKPRRNPLKRPKDRQQGTALLNVISQAMPHYPLDDAFASELPVELQPYYEAWARSA